MTNEQFKTLFKRIEAAFNQEYTPLQFEEWLDSFGNEDHDVAERAFRVMKDEFAYSPVVATFRSYVERIQEEDEAKAESTRKARADPDLLCNMSPEAKEAEFRRRSEFGRFLRWCHERHKFPKEDGDYQVMRKDFDENYKDWKPKERKTQKGMQKVGNLIGNLE